MNVEESRRLAIRVPELRMKELTSKLTAMEQQELDSMVEMKVKAYPEVTKQQYAENVRLTAIRNLTFKDVTPRATLFQKLRKKENLKEYEIELSNEKDVAEYDLHFTFALELRQLMEDVGLGLDWPKMLPVDFAMYYTDKMDEDEKRWFLSFPDPAWCSAKLDEAKNLQEKAGAYGENMQQLIQWLHKHWEAGYKIYADIDPDDDDWD